MMMRKNCPVEIIRLTSSVLCQNELEEDLYSSENSFLLFFSIVICTALNQIKESTQNYLRYSSKNERVTWSNVLKEEITHIFYTCSMKNALIEFKKKKAKFKRSFVFVLRV